MLCQNCKKREAVVHLTKIVNNEKTALSLCKECAAAKGFHSPLDNMPFPLAEILSTMAATVSTPKGSEPKEEITCPQCGMTFDDFTRQGRFGCGGCYKAFRNRLEPIMRKIHGSSLHRGGVPTSHNGESGESIPIPVKEEERLEEELKKAIDSEEFERAADIRDKLKAIRDSQSVQKQQG